MTITIKISNLSVDDSIAIKKFDDHANETTDGTYNFRSFLKEHLQIKLDDILQINVPCIYIEID